MPAAWTEGDTTFTRSICWSPPGCHGGCGVILESRAGRLTGVRGDPANPFNQGKLCVRGLHIVEAVNHPDRITRPLIRNGPRGADRWREASFAEAVDLVVDRLADIRDEHGPESVIFAKGTARDIGVYLPRLCFGFGSPNYFGFGPGNGNACFRPRVAVSQALLGNFPTVDLGQFDVTPVVLPQCIIIWGANPIHSNPDGYHGSWIIRALKQGSRLIVVDPQETWLARRADLWLRLKPGSDGALALGMIHQLFQQDLVDRSFCQQWVKGVEEIEEATTKYPPDRVETETSVTADAIIRAAQLFGSSKPAGLFWGVSVDMNPDCVNTISALIALMTLTGNIDLPGGMVFASDPFGVRRRGDLAEEFPQVTRQRIGAEEYPLTEVGNPYGQPDVLLNQMESGQPYPIKAAWLQATGIVPASFADPERVLTLFRALDFNVVVDLFKTPAAVALADVVLPVAMYPEKNSLYVQVSQLGATCKAVDPPGECRSDAEVILAVGKRLAPDAFSWNTAEEWIEERLQPAGLSFAELAERGSLKPPLTYRKHEKELLRKDGQPGFETPSGKIELDSSVLQTCGLASLPRYRDYVQEYRMQYDAGLYPYILTTGARKPYYFCSEHRQIPSLRAIQPEPGVDIHPMAATRAGIQEGDSVRIFNPFGDCFMVARINERFPADVIHCDYGWWYPEREAAEPELFGLRRANVNNLLPSGLEGPGGFGYPFRCFICNIEKADE